MIQELEFLEAGAPMVDQAEGLLTRAAALLTIGRGELKSTKRGCRRQKKQVLNHDRYTYQNNGSLTR
ncbi:MAG: hypothetical protein K9M13_01405 [Simkaniaceae bacterium]|nr:hypothetical protein [Simkaniaceae bacterium]